MDLTKTIKKARKNFFLFQQLVSRDFKEKYKRTTLGVLWSVLSPLLTLYVLKLVFEGFFGRDMPHFGTYMFAGVITISFFRECTRFGMTCLVKSAKIISKINIPKYLFIFAKSVSSFVNYLLTVVVFLIYAFFEGIAFKGCFVMLVYPIITLLMTSLGLGMVLSCCFIFFRDTAYFYDVFLRLLNYVSVVFYTIDRFPEEVRNYFLFNPVYAHILYFRTVTLDGRIPGIGLHIILALFGCGFLFFGFYLYKKYNHQFIYYI